MSLSSFANASWLKQLPAESFENSIVELYPYSPASQWLTHMGPQIQKKAMETWFLHRFCSPKNRLPFDAKRRQYTFFNGGPFSAEYELVSRFHLVVSEDVIMSAVAELESSGEKLWILRTGAVLESSFGQCQVVEPYDPLNARLSELYQMVNHLPEPVAEQLLEVIYFEAIRNFELFCVELVLYRASTSIVVAERLIKMLLLTHNDTTRIHLSDKPDETVLNLLRQRLLVQPWYHWPTFIYLLKDGLQLNVSSLSGIFGRVYSSHYRRRFGFNPSFRGKTTSFSPAKLHQLKLSILRLAKKLQDFEADVGCAHTERGV